jgi:hypothetical protein
MQIQLIRHATLVVTLGDLKLLVDPMLSAAGAMDPVANAANQRRIPLMDAINHCLLTRADLREQLRIADRLERVRIPQDGETLTFA